MVWLPDDEESMIIYLAVSTQYRRITGGHRHFATAYSALCIASRGKNVSKFERPKSAERDVV